MIKRPFFAMLGLGAGIAIGIYLTKQARAAQEALKPSSVAARAVTGAGGLRERLAAAVEEGRTAAGRKEAELRTTYLVGEVVTGAEPATGTRNGQ